MHCYKEVYHLPRSIKSSLPLFSSTDECVTACSRTAGFKDCKPIRARNADSAESILGEVASCCCLTADRAWMARVATLENSAKLVHWCSLRISEWVCILTSEASQWRSVDAGQCSKHAWKVLAGKGRIERDKLNFVSKKPGPTKTTSHWPTIPFRRLTLSFTDNIVKVALYSLLLIWLNNFFNAHGNQAPNNNNDEFKRIKGVAC